MRDQVRALHDAAARVLGLPFLPIAELQDGLNTEDLCAIAELDECIDEYRKALVPVCPGCGSRAVNVLVCKRCKKTAAHCTCMDREAIRSGACNRVPCEHSQHPRLSRCLTHRPGSMFAGRIDQRFLLDLRETDMNTPEKHEQLIRWFREVVFTRVRPGA
jgi:hypothetical protein